jgi:hypothetical protein
MSHARSDAFSWDPGIFLEAALGRSSLPGQPDVEPNQPNGR